MDVLYCSGANFMAKMFLLIGFMDLAFTHYIFHVVLTVKQSHLPPYFIDKVEVQLQLKLPGRPALIA